MIAISALLVLIAIVALAVGFTGSSLNPGLATTGMILVYVSIGLCVVAGVLLIAGYVSGRRKAKRRPGRSGRTSGKKATSGAPRSGGGGDRKPESRRKAPTRKAAKAGGRAATASGAVGVLDEGEVPDDADIVVVPGRLRYHLPSCRQVTRRDTEELTVAEAREQGYVACTACRPDAVLAARAETAVSGSEDAESDGAEDGGVESDDVESDDAEDEPAGAAEDDDDEPAQVLVVSGQRRYHVDGCQVVEDAREDGTDVTETTVADAEEQGLTPCRVCTAPADDDETDTETADD